MNIYAIALVVAVGAGLLFFMWRLALYENWIVSMLAGFTIGLGVIMAVPITLETLPGWARLAYCVGVGLFYRYAPLLFEESPARAGHNASQDILDAFFDEGAD